MDHFVEFQDVCKYYQTGSVKIAAADHMNFYVDKGEFWAVWTAAMRAMSGWTAGT